MIVTDRKFEQAQATAKKLGGKNVIRRLSIRRSFVRCLLFWHGFIFNLFMKLEERLM